MKVVGVCAPMPAVVGALGGSLPALCAESGLDPEVFADPRNVAPLTAFGRLLHLSAVRLNAPHFDLLVGARFELPSLGVIGELMRASETLRDALRALDNHFQVNNRGALLRFEEDRDAGYLSYSPYEPHEDAAQAVDLAVAAAVQLVREICDGAIVPLEIRLPRRAPVDLEPYRRLFRCPIRFNAPEGMVVFRSESLRRRLPGVQPALRVALERMIRKREAVTPLDFEEELRRSLRTEIVGTRTLSDTVAGRLAIDRRTVNRRLRPSGKSFKSVAEDLRFMVACQLLDDTSLQLGEIAATLDFAEAGSFTKAFQRWSGMAPRAWRDRPADLRSS